MDFIRYIKLIKTDAESSSISIPTLAEAEQIKIITPDLSSSIFTIKNITNQIEYVLLEVDSDISGTLNIARNTKILNYPKFKNQNLTTSSYTTWNETWIPLKFGSATTSPDLPDYSRNLSLGNLPK